MSDSISLPEHTSKKLKQDDSLFADINEEAPVTIVESLCMNCHKNGTTRLMLTRVPHFSDIILSSFECPHCGFKDNQVQSAAAAAELGQEWGLSASDPKDMSRQIVMAAHATVKFPQIELELPPSAKTRLTTLEGLLSGIIEDLQQDQPQRFEQNKNSFNIIGNIIQKLVGFSNCELPFSLIIDDPSGNSYIESLTPPNLDEKLSKKFYKRTKQHDILLGFAAPEEEPQDEAQQEPEPITLDEVFEFPSNCSSCSIPSSTRMKQIEIPHFKNVILMSTTCDSCGYKSNEVKSSGAIADHGTKIILKITDTEDLSRDILKSETCGLEIPEIELKLTFGTLGGRFTTIEGLLRQVHDELNRDSQYQGDAAAQERRKLFEGFLQKLDDTIEGKTFPITLILDDPVSNSYLQNPYAPDEDPNMTIETYERTFDQNEDLGLNDIKVENYES
ncbi:hypothetical protein BB561_001931 [Smittium simulii]|uniref:Zinc finger ZPR1-type domain-containing protein n=1 Tax=Smittium simulii TaxID=133385 RepID=A0A2T9YSG9_9FUNG|nr:hypothetical protein BB561_001931 [Smittium simulii]